MTWFDDWASMGRIAVAAVFGYAALVAMLRAAGKRTLAKMNAFDFVVTVALGSAFATFVLSDDLPILEGVAALGLLVGLQWTATALYVRSRWFERLVKGSPRLLLWQGEYLDDALRRERVTRDEVRSAMRAHDVDDRRMAAAVLETDGSVSIVTLNGDGHLLTGVDRRVSDRPAGVGLAHDPERRGSTMTDRSTRLQAEGNWDRFKGKAREQWGDLTDQELEQARGNWDQFVGTVKEKTGETTEAIERKFDEWTS